MKRVKLVLSHDELHAALGLAPDVAITGVYLTKPGTVEILCAADWFNDQTDGEIPRAAVDYLR